MKGSDTHYVWSISRVYEDLVEGVGAALDLLAHVRQGVPRLRTTSCLLAFFPIGSITVVDTGQPRKQYHSSVTKNLVQDKLPCVIFPCNLWLF